MEDEICTYRDFGFDGRRERVGGLTSPYTIRFLSWVRWHLRFRFLGGVSVGNEVHTISEVQDNGRLEDPLCCCPAKV
jgi:hypothetical protein